MQLMFVSPPRVTQTCWKRLWKSADAENDKRHEERRLEKKKRRNGLGWGVRNLVTHSSRNVSWTDSISRASCCFGNPLFLLSYFQDPIGNLRHPRYVPEPQRTVSLSLFVVLLLLPLPPPLLLLHHIQVKPSSFFFEFSQTPGVRRGWLSNYTHHTSLFQFPPPPCSKFF